MLAPPFLPSYKNIDRFQKGTRNLFFGRVLVGQLASLISVLLTLDSHARSRNNCEQRPSFGRAGNGLDENLLRPCRVRWRTENLNQFGGEHSEVTNRVVPGDKCDGFRTNASKEH